MDVNVCTANEPVADIAFVCRPQVDANADWLSVLDNACRYHPSGKTGVAEILGKSRTYIVRVLSTGKIHYAPPEKFKQLVLDRLLTVAICPHTQEAMPRSRCIEIANAQAPTHNPVRLAAWKACQRCQYKPAKE